ncbi:uncharacterized protein LOC114074457 [Solanum pennellii]|uniref:Uncharacterized protein LOC114074457 n=1 Tax=Solanum pennellii TaxID=28526 RepID=A0ABM1UXQ3_SOLPN|nr:uncharacterized protein LOC114074457 [Solanum pennellii]
MLPYALLGYRMTVRTSIGSTPYLLVYGTEAVIPAEVEIPSLRIIQEAELSNAEWVSKRIYQLTLIDEKRMVAVCHGQLYRQRMIRAFHKRVRARIFEISQLVLKRIFPHQEEYKGKFAPNWQGPYMVLKVLSGDSLVLSDMDGIRMNTWRTKGLRTGAAAARGNQNPPQAPAEGVVMPVNPAGLTDAEAQAMTTQVNRQDIQRKNPLVRSMADRL